MTRLVPDEQQADPEDVERAIQDLEREDCDPEDSQ